MVRNITVVARVIFSVHQLDLTGSKPLKHEQPSVAVLYQKYSSFKHEDVVLPWSCYDVTFEVEIP